MSAVPLVERQPSPMGETSVQEAVTALTSDVNADAANLSSDANTDTAAQVASHSAAHAGVVPTEAVTRVVENIHKHRLFKNKHDSRPRTINI